MAEDLGQEDVVGLVFGLEPVAPDGSVTFSQISARPDSIDPEL